MKKLSCILTLFALLFTQLYAQVPGYQGKKFGVEFGVACFPAFMGATSVLGKSNEKGIHIGFYGINWRLHGGFEYAFAKKWTLGLEGSYTQTAFSSYALYENDFRVNSKRNVQIQAGTIGIKVKKFIGTFFAPAGKFFFFETGALIMRAEDTKNFFYTPLNNLRTDNAATAYIGLGLGRKFIIANRLALGYELCLRIVIPTISSIEESTTYSHPSTEETSMIGNEKHPMIVNAEQRIFHQQLLNIKFTMGIIY